MKPLLKLELNGKSEVIEFINNKPFWERDGKTGWDIKHDGADKIIFATENLTKDILYLLSKGYKKAEINYDDKFKHYKAYYLKPFIINK